MRPASPTLFRLLMPVAAGALLTGCAVATMPVSAGDGGTGDGAVSSPVERAEQTIASVRDPESPTHAAYGDVVTVSGVVTDLKTAGTTHGFFLQDPKATSWAAVYVFVDAADVSVSAGDTVTVTGTYSTFFGLDEIKIADGGVTAKGRAARPRPLDVTVRDVAAGGPRERELQSMLVRVRNATATSSTNGTEFGITDASGGAIVVTSYVANDIAPSPFPASTGQRFSSIVGHPYAHNAAQLAPARAADVVAP